MGNTSGSPNLLTFPPKNIYTVMDFIHFPLFTRKLDLLLQDSPRGDLMNVANELKDHGTLKERDILEHLAYHIYNKALIYPEYCMKFVEFARLLKELISKHAKSKNRPSDADVFVSVFQEKFEQFEMNMELFYGNLFIADMISSGLMKQWIVTSGVKCSEIQGNILEVIKMKIIVMVRNGSNDRNVLFISRLLKKKMSSDEIE
jgi:hypothetical protein